MEWSSEDDVNLRDFALMLLEKEEEEEEKMNKRTKAHPKCVRRRYG